MQGISAALIPGLHEISKANFIVNKNIRNSQVKFSTTLITPFHLRK
jgi:hypothetical protein